jgi:hypothetical protein
MSSMTTTPDRQDVAGSGSTRASERQDVDAGGNTPAPAYPPTVQKALYLLNMNEHKHGVRPETVQRLRRQLRDACASYVEWFDSCHT